MWKLQQITIFCRKLKKIAILMAIIIAKGCEHRDKPANFYGFPGFFLSYLYETAPLEISMKNKESVGDFKL